MAASGFESLSYLAGWGKYILREGLIWNNVYNSKGRESLDHSRSDHNIHAVYTGGLPGFYHSEFARSSSCLPVYPKCELHMSLTLLRIQSYVHPQQVAPSPKILSPMYCGPLVLLVKTNLIM